MKKIDFVLPNEHNHISVSDEHPIGDAGKIEGERDIYVEGRGGGVGERGVKDMTKLWEEG